MSTARKQVTTYVDPVTYDWLLAGARLQNRSVSQFLAMRLKELAEHAQATEREEQ
jgi:hypothetical protein